MKFNPFFRTLSLILVMAMLLQMVPVQRVAAAEATSTEDTVQSAAVDVTEGVPPAKPVGEVETLRTETEKHFRMTDGSYMAVSYGMPVHYQNAAGQWQDIDNSVQLSANQAV